MLASARSNRFHTLSINALYCKDEMTQGSFNGGLGGSSGLSGSGSFSVVLTVRISGYGLNIGRLKSKIFIVAFVLARTRVNRYKVIEVRCSDI